MMSESVEIEPSSFKESMQQPVWVDAMVEEYDSIIRNNVWEVVPSAANKIEIYFTRLGFTKSEADAKLYHIVVEGKLFIIVPYVDDLILTNEEKLVKSCKENLTREFEMKDLELMHLFIGMEVWKEGDELCVSQGKYANEILKKFHMESNKPMETPLARNWRKEDATSGEIVEATI
eukprot:PITA_05718